MVLTKGSQRLFEWLRQQTAGTVVTYEHVKQVTGWSESSLVTYIHKNKIAPFLLRLKDRRLQVRLDGSDIEEQFFDETFTQQAPRTIVIAPGDRFVGEHETYYLDQQIGAGAIGQVWVAKANNNVRYAAKVMLPKTDFLQGSKMPDIRQRFRNESKYGQTLQHPNIVRYLDRGQTEKHPFLIMELADRSVADRLKSDSPVPEEEAAEIIDCCIEGLRYIHGRGHVHRDVKPANILEFADTYKLSDLGVVRWNDFDPLVTHAGAITRQSLQLGSWYYVAPEQQQHAHGAEPESDIYSLGVAWIEMLTGEPPAPQAVGARAYELPALREGVADTIHAMCSFAAGDRPALDKVQALVRSVYDFGELTVQSPAGSAALG